MATFEQILSESQAKNTSLSKKEANKDFNGKDITNYTKKVKSFGDAWAKALKQGDAKKLNALVHSMKQLKEIEKQTLRYKELEKQLKRVNTVVNDTNGIASPRQQQRISEISKEMEELKGNIKKVGEAFNESNRTGFQNFKKGLNDIAGSKFTKGSIIAAGAALVTNSFMQVDKAGSFTAQSLANMPTDEAAKAIGDLGSKAALSSNQFIRYGQQLYRSSKAFLNLNKETKKAVEHQKQLQSLTVITGQSLEEVSNTALEVMQRFRLTDKDDQYVNITRNVELLGKALGTGAGPALDFFEKRIRGLGGSSDDAQKDIVSLIATSDSLKQITDETGKVILTTSFNTKDLTENIFRAVEADTRHNQNIRVKTELMRKQIELSLRQGKTEEEALKAGQAAANSLAHTSKLVDRLTASKLSPSFEKDASKIKGLQASLAKAKTPEESQAIQKEIDLTQEKYLIGIEGEKERSAALKRLQGIQSQVNSGQIKGFSLQTKLLEEFGSSAYMAEQKYKTLQEQFGKTAPDSQRELLLSQFTGTPEEIAAQADLYLDAFNKKLTPKEFLKTTLTKERIEKTTANIGLVAEGKGAVKPVEAMINSTKALADSVSADFGTTWIGTIKATGDAILTPLKTATELARGLQGGSMGLPLAIASKMFLGWTGGSEARAKSPINMQAKAPNTQANMQAPKMISPILTSPELSVPTNNIQGPIRPTVNLGSDGSSTLNMTIFVPGAVMANGSLNGVMTPK